MMYDLDSRLVIGISSSALFNLTDCHRVYQEQGVEAYRAYQDERINEPLDPGVAFPFIRRLLALNDLQPDDPLVEVIVMSHNDAFTGLRIMASARAHGLPITRAIFMEGRSPHEYIGPLKMALFLSANEDDVRRAVASGMPAAIVTSQHMDDDVRETELRIAFDFDGVLADDSSEAIFKDHGLAEFQAHEQANAITPLSVGPLQPLLEAINRIQEVETTRKTADPDYRPRLHVSLGTARSAPAHERVVRSLHGWGVRVNAAFFLGGIDKAAILETLRPHIFFDDQMLHLTAHGIPGAHVPFGVRNGAQPVPRRMSTDDRIA